MARGRPIVIEFAANVREYLRGTRDVERATEDIADELKQAARESDKFEADFTDAMKDAERAADRSSRKIGDDFDKVPGKLGAVGLDAGDEFISNIGESIGSGDVGSIFQDVIGGVIGGLKGPMGLAAAGLGGLAVVAFQQVKNEAEALTEFYNSWQESFLGLVYQTRDALNAEAVEADYRQFLQDNQDLLTEFKPLLDELKIDGETFWKTLYNGGDAAEELLGYLGGVVDAGYAAELEGGNEQLVAAKAAARQIIPEVEKVVSGTDDATTAAQAYSDAIGEDALGAVTGLKEEWLGNDRFLRSQAAIPIRQQFIIETTVTGDGQAYVNPNSSKYTASRVATKNLHARNRRAD